MDATFLDHQTDTDFAPQRDESSPPAASETEQSQDLDSW
jgi:hypothetical protein